MSIQGVAPNNSADPVQTAQRAQVDGVALQPTSGVGESRQGDAKPPSQKQDHVTMWAFTPTGGVAGYMTMQEAMRRATPWSHFEAAPGG